MSCSEDEIFQIEKWPNGNVPYKYSGSFTENEKLIIESSMKEWKACGKIKFIEKSDADNFTLHIEKLSNDNHDGYSTYGFQDNPEIRIGNVSRKVTRHEFGHVLGIMHEHQRPDRDKFITVNMENVMHGFEENFYKLTSNYYLYNFSSYSYDMESVMHYDRLSYSKNGLPTINIPSIKQFYITKSDCDKISEIYGE
jgi:hypothetical protein